MDDKKRVSLLEDRIKELEWKMETISSWIFQKFGESIPLEIFQKTEKQPHFDSDLDNLNLNQLDVNFLQPDFFEQIQGQNQNDNDMSIDIDTTETATTIQSTSTSKNINLAPLLPSKSREFLIQECSKREAVIKLEKLPTTVKHSKSYKYILDKSASTKASNLIYKKVRARHKKQILCKICNCSFSNSNYSEHNFSHKSELERSCPKCPVGTKVFKTHWGFTHHQKLHEDKEKGLEPIKFVCPVCGIAVKQLSNHMTVHDIPKIKTLLCSECPKVFATEKTLQRHIKVVHNKEDKVVEKIMCSECGLLTKDQGAHQRHLNRIHLRLKFKCDFPACNRFFADKYSLEMHKDLHNPSIIHKCTYSTDCTREFKTKTQLRTHIRCGHQLKDRENKKVSSNQVPPPPPPPIYKCYIENCQDQTFSSSLDLECHIQLCHFDVIENSSTICTKCGRKFSTKLTCQQHVKRIHGDLNEKQYKCPDEGCDKYFAFETDLQNHSKIHLPLEVQRDLKIKRLKNCPKCNKLVNPGNLKRHLRRHENNFGEISCTFSDCWMKFQTEEQLNLHYSLHSRPKIFLLEKKK